MSTAPVPDGELFYTDTGHGRPIVLMHGGALDLRMWDGQVSPLTERYRVIRYDARGHGRSSTPTTPFRQCDDTVALLDHLDLPRATLVGLSMGAGAATDATLEYPERVVALAVSGAGTNEPTFTDPWMLDLQQTMVHAQEDEDADAWVDAFVRAFVVGPHRTSDDLDTDVRQRCREMAMNTVSTHATPDAVPPDHVEGSWGRLGEITRPVLTIVGALDADDHLAMVQRMAEAVDGSSSVVIDAAAHMPNMERPQDFNARLLEFLVATDHLATGR